jgi:hypothetical protein
MARRNEVDILIRARDQATKTLRNVDRESNKLDATFNKLALTVGSFFSLAAISAGGAKAIKASSDLRESQNAVNVVFAEGAETVLKFGENSAKAAGLATSEFNQLSAVTGALLKDTSLSMTEVAEQTNLLAVRAADMASVMNTTVQDALSAANQALRGETEAIRRYTGDVTDASLETFRLSEGMTKSVTKMSEQEKRLLRLALIFKQTDKFAGDFANTSEELANQQRIAAANTENLAAKYGQKLIPVVTEAISIYNEFIESLTSTEFERAVTKLEKIGGDSELIKQLKVQVEINKLLEDQVRIDKELSEFSVTTTEARRVIGKQLWFDKVTYEEINKLTRLNTEELIEQSKKTKDVSALQAEIKKLSEDRINLQANIVEQLRKGKTEDDAIVVDLRLQQQSLEKIFDSASRYVALITEREVTESSIAKLMEDQKQSQDDITNKVREEFIIRDGGVNIQMLDNEQMQKKLINQETYGRKIEDEFELRNDIKDLTAEQILADQKAFVLLNEFGPALARAYVQGQKLRDVIQDMVEQLVVRGLVGLVGGLIGMRIPGAGFGAGFNVGFGAPVFNAQHGDSGRFPGQGSRERPYWGMARPGEDFEISSGSKVINLSVSGGGDVFTLTKSSFRSFMREVGYEVVIQDTDRGKGL